MYRNVELRKLPPDALRKVVGILEKNKDWKKVMSVIPKDLQSEDFEPKYNNEQIRIIEEHAKATNQNCTDILMDEWGTSGRIRPTLGTLKEILNKSQIFSRAAEEVAIMLNPSVPERPSYIPAEPGRTKTKISDESAEPRPQDKGTAVTSNKNQKENGSTRQKGCTNDNKTYSNEMLPDQVKPTPDFIDFNKEQHIQKSMNIQNAGYVLHESYDITNESKDKKSQKIYQHYPKPYQTSFPNINISTGIHSALLPDTDLAHSDYDKSTAVKSNDNKSCISEMLPDQEFMNIGGSSYMLRERNNASSQSHRNMPTEIASAVLQNTNLIHFDYDDLDNITGNFAKFLINDPSHGPKGRIGSGGFGDVFVGKDPTFGMVAVKKAHSHLAIPRKPNIAITLFNTEVKCLSQFRHNNIVPILGFSMNGPFPCIVFEYIDGGSLQQNIKAKILNEFQRMHIIIGTAEGLKYLHSSSKESKEGILNVVGESDSQKSIKHFVHGDIKSANILLTRNCVPKLCDFGLAKQYDSTFVTTCPLGTPAYMAPEGMHGTVTQKIDIYSFGIVILELLTGLKPIVEINGADINIKHYVEENVVNNDITPLLDPVVKIWVKADEVYKLAKMCLEYDRKMRPTIIQLSDILNKILFE
ncbi:LEAF RUST 10 DISEASE-RESISTANCE LOCUS RECEPTOR-LIKE PROTEIN KINASE-like 1.1 [Maniola jurtina]|uniref:LEAF RUST 10 DISEASE-RESISTANCE LOCUS RECEPTOR-LIKE PROTEIN KINASE-like 1.1 n=1 Tax=Maniola jurtina TaxID=191418 RepID=UPI001E68C248|nr:LEAF RUST 10 DISEASE-RESISTANCE LOCUS RECEPTOR-LIKE PROTEIN KINASE-like 1.1 [Maniola jurtina]